MDLFHYFGSYSDGIRSLLNLLFGLTPWHRHYVISLIVVVLAALFAENWTRSKAFRNALVILAVLLHLRYILWRLLYTLNPSSLFVLGASLILFGAELYGFLSMGLFYMQTLFQRKHQPVPLNESKAPSVDILITIFNEDINVLYQTLACATAVDYPAGLKKIYVLDDGRRKEVRELAERMGCGYIARANNEFAKAGNINHALPLTHGDLIAFLDCDHMPVSTFLRDTVGFFQDPKVAIVQTPHHFYNPDSYQKNLLLERTVAHEQELFFHVIMPGHDRFNSAFFAGSSGLMRRSALEAMGGFQVSSVIEDVYTSMELHARGWSSVYYDRILTGALSPESFRGYLLQHQRWARGGVQIFFADNPLFKRGLTLMQRLNYFASLLYFFHGWPRVIFLLTPLVFAFTGHSPIVTSLPMLASFFIPYYFSVQAGLGLTGRRYRNPFWSDLYETASCFALSWTALVTMFRPEKVFFQITPKGSSSDSKRLSGLQVLPHWIVMGLLILGGGLTILRVLHKEVPWDLAFIVLIWTFYNLILLGAAIAVARERPLQRRHYRIARRLHCEITAGAEIWQGSTRNMSEDGQSLVLHTASGKKVSDLPSRVTMQMGCHCNRKVVLQGRVVRQTQASDNEIHIGIEYENLDDTTRRDLLRLIFGCPETWRVHHQPFSFVQSFRDLLEAFERLRFWGFHEKVGGKTL